MTTRCPWRHRIFQIVLSQFFLWTSFSVSAQFQWTFAGKSYPTRTEAAAALRAHPSPQYLQFAEPWYEEILWRDPSTALYWFTLFDYQPANDIQFAGYTVNKSCGFFDGTDCNATIGEAVDSSHPNPTAVLCDVEFEVLGEFEFKQQQWEEVLENGVRFWASESAPIRIDFFHTNLNTGNCDYGSSVHQTVRRISLASCTHDLSPISGNYSDWDKPPEFPKICSPGGREPPVSNIAAISRRLTSVCTATEGNPCSPMTGNKSLAETDFSAGAFEFTRHYHSSRELGASPVGEGWTHSYSTRLISSGGYTLIKPDGNVEEFSAAPSGNYRSITAPGKILVVEGDLAQLTYPGGNKEIYQWVPSSADSPERFRLVEIYPADHPDMAITLSYREPGGFLESVTDPQGRQIRFEYDPAGFISALLLPDGHRIRYQRDALQNLSEVTYQDGSQRVYRYEDPRLPHHVTGIIDENGVRFATYQYDSFGRVTLSEHAAGAERVLLDYVGTGATEVTGPLGDVRRYEFDPFKPSFETRSVVDSDGASSWSRNADGWPIEKRDAAGHVVQSAYDEFHEIQRVEAYGTPEQRTIQFTWNNELNRKIRIDEPGRTTRFDYDDVGRLNAKSIEDSSSGSIRYWRYHYFPDSDLPARAGRLRSVDGPRTDVADITTYSYYLTDDPDGRYRAGDLASVINAAGHITMLLEYDGNGRLTRTQDANGVITVLGYHPRGWLASVSIAGVTTAYTHDKAGNLVRTVSPDGSHVDYAYDAAHRLTAIFDSQGNRIEYTLDPGGNRIEENILDDSHVLRRHLSRTFDSVGRLQSITDSAGDSVSYTYDANGSLIRSRDGNLHDTHHEYDALDRRVSSVDPLGGKTLMAYDDRDNLIRITDPGGNTTEYRYDGLDALSAVTSPDTGMTSHVFDDAGNRVASTGARGVRVEYHYDELNRLTDIVYPDDSKNVSFSYDAAPNGKGRLTGMRDQAGSVSWEYDHRGNLSSESRWIDGRQYQTNYTYDAADRLIRLEYPSGRTVSFKRDNAGRVSQIQAGSQWLVGEVRREPFGPVRSFTYGNGLEYSARFNLDQELTRLESGAGMILDLQYGPAGSILRINDRTFTYDPLYRLVASAGGQASRHFAYDGNENRLRYQDSLSDSSYTYENDTNRIATAGQWSFTHDGAGNRTGKLDPFGDGQLYRYGDDNRMTESISRAAGADLPAVNYLYDGRGRRIVKAGPERSTHFVYNHSGQLIGEYTVGTERDYREYVYLEGLPVAVLARSSETVQTPGAELVLDDGDQGTAASGNWREKTSREDFGAGYLFAPKFANTSYRWTATPPGARYRVYAWWVGRKNQSEHVDYTIRHGIGELDTVTRSHKSGGGSWQLLGSYARGDGQDYVEVRSRDNRFVADAIRWVAINEPVVIWNDTTHYIHFDHLGTPRQITDENQSVVWRWDHAEFGNSSPDEDPDGDSNKLVFNLRFPGQYYDAETGLHYNFFRTYDPETGRYLEADPLGLAGGMNPYSYVGGNPLSGIDPLGLATVGSWIDPPRFNLTEVGVYDWEIIAPKWSWWGYADFIKLHGHASGFVNIDVSCKNECEDWEIHDKIEVAARGSVDVGPNVYAILIGLRFGPLAGVAGNAAIGGAAMLEAEHRFLSLADEKAGPILAAALKFGPTGICLGMTPGF